MEDQKQGLTYKDLLDAGVHFGHLTRKWNPKMAPYIFMERNGIHIIDLNKTLVSLEEACNAVREIARSGKKIMFVATKKQAREVVAQEAARLKMPYITERWLGGMLTNFATIRKSLKKMATIDRKMKESAYDNLTKKERLMLGREKDKLESVLGGIADLNRIPSALFVIDINKEHIAIAEAHKLGIPVIALTDTNTDPDQVDFAVPANDDAYKSVSLLTKTIGKAIEEGLLERKQEKENSREQEVAEAEASGDAERLAKAGETAESSDAVVVNTVTEESAEAQVKAQKVKNLPPKLQK